MSLNINLSSELEHAVRERAMAAGLDIDTYAARIFAERLQEESAGLVRSIPGSFRESLQRIIAMHPTSRHGVDDSRESIYAGRGE